MPRQHWDIFCTVIDNYGDIGVTWRLARQLSHEHGLQVRLWVDDLASFARIAPGLDASLPEQAYDGVTVRHWPQQGFPAVAPAEMVIEAFGCRLPESYEQAMAAQAVKPLWINLEYLSAEDWVGDCHLLPSPHPSLPLTKYFYFPGFGPKAGGLVCEAGLMAERAAWQANAAARNAYWQSLELPPPQPDELRISLFSYENPAAAELLEHWAQGSQTVTCLLPVGKALPEAERVLGRKLAAGDRAERGALAVHALPMTDQAGYDRLLWSCDFNCVRGEDSFVRAQWAARPFLWHIYPQDDAAHIVKLDAFLTRYLADCPAALAEAAQAAQHAWNHGRGMAEAWQRLAPQLPAWQGHAAAWPGAQLQQGSLLDKLLHFIREIG